MQKIAEFRRVSDEYAIAEHVIDVHRADVQATAVDLGLLDLERAGWRERQAAAEMMGALMLARSAGLDWAAVCRLGRRAAAEVYHVEARRGGV